MNILSVNNKVRMTLPSSNSKTYLELLDGRVEELSFTQINPTSFVVNDSEFSVKSGITVDLEIENVDLVATSTVLWPGQQIRVRGGLNGKGETIKASATIPVGEKMANGVEAESFLYWIIDTPEGSFHNNEPIHMKGRITGLPPKDADFHSQGTIAIYDEQENRVGTLYGCLQSN